MTLGEQDSWYRVLVEGGVQTGVCLSSDPVHGEVASHEYNNKATQLGLFLNHVAGTTPASWIRRECIEDADVLLIGIALCLAMDKTKK